MLEFREMALRKIHIIPFLFALILGSMLSACDWDANIGEFTGELCPPLGAYDRENATVLDCAGPDKNNCYHSKVGRCKHDYICMPLETGSDTYHCSLGNIVSVCTHGQIKCDGECVTPSSSALFCGAKGYCNSYEVDSKNYRGERCDSRQICVQGECKCLDAAIKCNEQCINPDFSQENCGAKGSCLGSDENADDYEGIACDQDESCVAGKCIRFRCPSGMQLCPDPQNIETYICVNITDGDTNNCGGCGFNCEPQRFHNANLKSCKNSNCIYECDLEKGYENCNKVDVGYESPNPVCINNTEMLTSSLHCGKCNNVCGADKFCESGKCVEHKCASDTCPPFCINEAKRCGSSCEDCTKIANHAENMVFCENGACKVKECAEGYHLTSLKPGNTCIKNSFNDCGLPHQVGSPCTDGRALSGHCEQGKCVVEECKPSYRLVDGKCLSKDLKDCCQYTNAYDGICIDDKCDFSFCMSGYHIKEVGDNKTCEKNADSLCAPQNSSEINNCLKLYKFKEDSNYTSLEVVNHENYSGFESYCNDYGFCQVKTCPENFHIERITLDNTPMDGLISKDGLNNKSFLWNEFCVENTQKRCAARDSYMWEDCSQLLSAQDTDAPICSNGSCTVQDCPKDMVKKNGRCLCKACSEVANVLMGTCSENTCTPSVCEPEYHIFKDTETGIISCRRNSIVQCGAVKVYDNHKIENCTSLQGAAFVTCTQEGRCKPEFCVPRYHLKPERTACEKNTTELCGLVDSHLTINCKTKYWTKPGVPGGGDLDYDYNGIGLCWVKTENTTNNYTCNGVKVS